jgi:peroxin-4
MKWSVVMNGPADTPFHSGTFKLRISIPSNYPLAPPTVTFVTKIFHPNIHWKTGEICLDILKNEWSPIWGLSSTCLAILALLSHPAPDSPLNCDAGNMLRADDHRSYFSLARMYAIEHAGARAFDDERHSCCMPASVSAECKGTSADAVRAGAAMGQFGSPRQ